MYERIQSRRYKTEVAVSCTNKRIQYCKDNLVRAPAQVSEAPDQGAQVRVRNIHSAERKCNVRSIQHSYTPPKCLDEYNSLSFHFPAPLLVFDNIKRCIFLRVRCQKCLDPNDAEHECYQRTGTCEHRYYSATVSCWIQVPVAYSGHSNKCHPHTILDMNEIFEVRGPANVT